MKFDKILCRYGEITLKGPYTRRFFENTLISNITKGLRSEKIEFEIKTEPGRLFVKTKKIDDSCEILKKIFGLTSISPVKEVIVKGDIEKLTREGVKFATNFIKKGDKFAVRAKRTGNDSFTSQMIERKIGADIIKKIGSTVDLTNPDKTVYVEVRQNKAYFFKERIKCPGGLPIGTQGNVLVLFSGGIDSAVSAWMMMKRGCTITPLFFEITGQKSLNRTKSVLNELNKWYIGHKTKLIVLKYKKILDKIGMNCKANLTCLLCKRMMYRIAEKIAEKNKTKIIVTGENLGQVASQTLDNLNVLDHAIQMPVLRPLIGMNKEEIVEIAKIIGTYEASIQPHESCPHVPEKPRTKGRLNEVIGEEKKLDIEKMTNSLVIK